VVSPSSIHWGLSESYFCDDLGHILSKKQLTMAGFPGDTKTTGRIISVLGLNARDQRSFSIIDTFKQKRLSRRRADKSYDCVRRHKPPQVDR
jgi:hypothetical protein